MDARSLTYLADACRGEQIHGSPEAEVRRVCTDSRHLRAGDLFVALSGEKFDGHLFLPEVIRKGATAAVVERSKAPQDPGPCAIVTVEDTRLALGRLASRYRRDFDIRAVAVCGSNGKTTTKELVASVLRQRLSTLCNEASFNNDVGVPLTLLNLLSTHEAAVLEAGTNHPGELRPLLEMIAPKYGLITNVGREHLEFFGSLEGVAQEEGTLAEMLPPEGKLFLLGDSPWADLIAARSNAQVVTVGTDPVNDWMAVDIRLDAEGATFRLQAPVDSFTGDYRVNLLGRHQVLNALFAVAAGYEFGLTAAEVRKGLAECKPPRMRMQSWSCNGVRVLDDAYNANADSMTAALRALAELPCQGRRVAVLGDMAELGEHALSAHMEIGRKTAEYGIGQLFAIGKMAAVTAGSARAAGMGRVFDFADVEGAAAAIRSFVKPGDLVLVKASRSARLERVSEELKRL